MYPTGSSSPLPQYKSLFIPHRSGHIGLTDIATAKSWKDSWSIANHCDCLTNNITDRNMRITSYQTFVSFPLCFFPSGLSSVTKTTPCNSAAEQEPAAPAMSVCLSQAFQGWSLNKAVSVLCSLSHAISVQLC